jgi:rhodanese-related sulfurtransferase
MEDLKKITTEELQKRLEAGEQLELVDVREDEEVAAGMIPGAKHIKMGDIAMNLDYFDPDKEYIMICRSSRRSENVCWFLHDHGVKVVNMVGGMLEWKGEVK